MLIYGRDQAIIAWAEQQLKTILAKPAVAIGVAHGHELVAAAIYNNYRPPNIEVTFVTTSPRWASPGAVKRILSYPFLQLDCRRITATTEATNKRACAFLCRLGFEQEGYHPDALPSGDAVTFGLLRKNAARWLAEEPYGEVITNSTAAA